MNPLDFVGSDDLPGLLSSLLSGSEIPYRREGELFRFLLASRGRRWETVCRCREKEVLVYGRYPFQTQADFRLLETCNEINAKVIQGALFFWEGEILFRTCASCAQPLDAAENLIQALEYNAAVVAEFWPQIQRAAMKTDS